MDEASITEVDPDDRVGEFVRRRGGSLYVWADGAGMVHARTTPPRAGHTFVTYPQDGWQLNVDKAIPAPEIWFVQLKRFPWKRVSVLYNGAELSTGAWISGQPFVPPGVSHHSH